MTYTLEVTFNATTADFQTNLIAAVTTGTSGGAQHYPKYINFFRIAIDAAVALQCYVYRNVDGYAAPYLCCDVRPWNSPGLQSYPMDGVEFDKLTFVRSGDSTSRAFYLMLQGYDPKLRS